MSENIAMEILQAIRYGLVDEFKCLISQVPNIVGVDSHGHSLLSQAVKMNRIEMVEELLSRGVNPCTPCDSINESVPLHTACRQGHLGMVVTLMKHGADPLQRDDDGQTAIHIAAKSGKSSIVTYFLAMNVSPDVTDFAGNTSLIMAASTDSKNTSTVLALLKYRAHVNRCDYINGNAALHCAIKGGNLVVAKLLLQNEGLPDIKNKLGQTAIDLIVNQKIENAERDDILLLASQNSRSFKSVNLNREWPIAAVPALIFAWTLQVLASNVSYGTKAIWILLLFVMLHFVLQNVAEVNLSRIFPVSFVLTLKFFKYCSWYKWLLPGISWAPALLFMITAATSTFMCVGCLKDPGFCYTSNTKRNKNVMELSKGNMMDNKHWCATCMMRRPLRSKHCHQCGKCVARFDHHCPFLCNCIGWKNHADFVIFLIADALASIIYLHCFTTAIGIQCGLLQLAQIHAKELYAAIVTTLECIFTAGLLVLQIYQISWLGLTTNERLNWKRYRQDYYAAYPSNRTPFDKGIVANVNEFFGSCLNSKLTTDWNYKYNLD